MRSTAEQIQAILRENTSSWAKSQLAPGELLDFYQYSDFIDVTPDEVITHVNARGFDPSRVWTHNDPPSEKDDKIVVEPEGGKWTVYYSERGNRSDQRTFDTQAEAVRDAVMRLMSSAWSALNHRYWHRHHPSLPRLPAFGEPWPAEA